MYLIIAYHGKGKNEVEKDLNLLWGRIRGFTKIRLIRHIYCFQAVRDEERANALIIINYKGAAAKPQYSSGNVRNNIAVSQTHHRVDYWFYVRNSSQKKEA